MLSVEEQRRQVTGNYCAEAQKAGAVSRSAIVLPSSTDITEKHRQPLQDAVQPECRSPPSDARPRQATEQFSRMQVLETWSP